MKTALICLTLIICTVILSSALIYVGILETQNIVASLEQECGI